MKNNNRPIQKATAPPKVSASEKHLIAQIYPTSTELFGNNNYNFERWTCQILINARGLQEKHLQLQSDRLFAAQ